MRTSRSSNFQNNSFRSEVRDAKPTGSSFTFNAMSHSHSKTSSIDYEYKGIWVKHEKKYAELTKVLFQVQTLKDELDLRKDDVYMLGKL
jgi:hypothetical protein